MKTIYKYKLEFEGSTKIKLPYGSKVVHVGLDLSRVARIWVEQHPDKGWPQINYTERKFYIYGTGHDIPGAAEHVGTFKDGPFVWHVYEEK